MSYLQVLAQRVILQPPRVGVGGGVEDANCHVLPQMQLRQWLCG